MQSIEIHRLAYILLPALLVVALQLAWALHPKTTLYAIARMILQLVFIGYALTYIFGSEHSMFVLAILAVMLLVSAWIALRPIAKQRTEFYWKALFATVCINGCLLFIITHGVLQVEPWYAPNVVIPLAGMVFATGMNSMSLFGERYFADIGSVFCSISEK